MKINLISWTEGGELITVQCDILTISTTLCYIKYEDPHSGRVVEVWVGKTRVKELII